MRRPSLPAVVAALAALSACSYFRVVRGRVVAEDGATGVTCSIVVLQESFGVADTCEVEGTAGPDRVNAIPLGGRFECQPSANVDVVYDLNVSCPGYVPLDRPLPIANCSRSLFGGCDDVELGTLVLRRSR